MQYGGGGWVGWGVPLLMRGRRSLAAYAILGISDHVHTIFLAVKPNIVGVAGANMQWGHFVCPSCCQKRENTEFELVLQSTFVCVLFWF